LLRPDMQRLLHLADGSFVDTMIIASRIV